MYAVCVARAAPGVHGACVHTRTGENSAGSCVCICMRVSSSVCTRCVPIQFTRSSSFNRSTFSMYIYVWRVYDTWCMLTSVIWRETPRQPTSHASFFLFSPHSPLLWLFHLFFFFFFLIYYWTEKFARNYLRFVRAHTTTRYLNTVFHWTVCNCILTLTFGNASTFPMKCYMSVRLAFRTCLYKLMYKIPRHDS